MVAHVGLRLLKTLSCYHVWSVFPSFIIMRHSSKQTTNRAREKTRHFTAKPFGQPFFLPALRDFSYSAHGKKKSSHTKRVLHICPSHHFGFVIRVVSSNCHYCKRIRLLHETREVSQALGAQGQLKASRHGQSSSEGVFSTCPLLYRAVGS